MGCPRAAVWSDCARVGSDTARCLGCPGFGPLCHATRVPQEGVSKGQQGSPLTTAGHRSRPGPGRHCRVPKLTINRRCLRQASAPGWPKANPESGESPAARVSRHVGSGGVADQRQGSMSFSRRVLYMDPCPWPAPLQGKAADATGYPLTHSHVLRQDATPRTSGDLVSCPSRARSPGDSRGTTDTHGQNLTDSAPEHVPAHRPL